MSFILTDHYNKISKSLSDANIKTVWDLIKNPNDVKKVSDIIGIEDNIFILSCVYEYMEIKKSIKKHRPNVFDLNFDEDNNRIGFKPRRVFEYTFEKILEINAEDDPYIEDKINKKFLDFSSSGKEHNTLYIALLYQILNAQTSFDYMKRQKDRKN